ncbi:hypothetical protein GCM10007092_08380 [Thermus composti]|uniref:Uncharacterized protein n=1 Tax=Thermus composti TaxID=532059 RepID=A0ABV6PXM7_9DEIN|nr:hypothetical protein [Thermus composti]GGM97042.1 hypothetical protein GCM10007092_08380 [Thermus composti]
MEPGLYPVLGPPASGKTTFALGLALEALGEGKRVYWVGLPHQRPYVLRLLGEKGAFLGLEFLSFQALYYRVLAEAGRLGPLLPGAGRVALVGEALRLLYGEPAPGEARLFARAIAELKRFGLSPFALPKEGEVGRLRRVYLAYERLKRKALDYDDVRHLAGKVPLRLFPEPGLVVVDGFREVGPLDLVFLKRLSRKVPVLLALELLPEGLRPWKTLSRRPLRQEVLALANPVEEVRHLLRALKQALAPKDLGGEGLRPEEVLVVAPEARIPGLLLLKEEFGLPLWDGRERSLGETEEGARLLALLNPFPTGRDLLALGFSALGRKALRLGLVGEEALFRLAREEGLLEEWEAFRALRTPGEDPLAWAEEALERLGIREKEPFLDRLRYALRVAPKDPLPWWRSLLLDEALSPGPPGGVEVLPPLRAMGVRAKRAYVLSFLPGAYALGEREDYFLLEELREEGLLARLPKRLRGLDPLFWEALATRGEENFLLYPEAGPGGAYLPLRRGSRPDPLPPSTPLEALPGEGFAPPWPSGGDGLPRLEALRRFLECPFRAYLERFPWREEGPWRRLAREGKALEADPQVGPWLRRHRDHLEGMRFYTPWPRERFLLLLDGVRWEGRVLHLYRLLPQGAAPDLERRWTEWYALGLLLRREDVEAVWLWSWPFLEDPRPYRAKPFRKGDPLPRLKEVREELKRALAGWKKGVFPPRPGSRCFACSFADICRKEAL